MLREEIAKIVSRESAQASSSETPREDSSSTMLPAMGVTKVPKVRRLLIKFIPYAVRPDQPQIANRQTSRQIVESSTRDNQCRPMLGSPPTVCLAHRVGHQALRGTHVVHAASRCRFFFEIVNKIPMKVLSGSRAVNT